MFMKSGQQPGAYGQADPYAPMDPNRPPGQPGPYPQYNAGFEQFPAYENTYEVENTFLLPHCRS